ncbi:MAG TPA: diacylglycerol kinase family protein [Parafilimonas sp.]
MSRKIIYVYNPISGTKRKEALLKKIESATKAKQLNFEFLTANPNGDYELLKKKIQREKITDVVIIGGDGTISQVTGALRNCDVRFGIIPAGSGNGLAYTAAIPGNTSHALQMIFNQSSKKTDAFLINSYYACMLSGLGFDATIAHKFAAHPNRGLVTYAQQTLLHFFKATTYRFEIIMCDYSFFTDAYFISIANSNQFGNNVTIAPKAKLNDGLLDIVIVQKMHKAKLVFAVLKQIRGNNNLQLFTEDNSKTGVLYFQTDALTIRNLKHAPLHIDGDPYETADEFKIEIIKNSFELIRP